MHREMRSGRLKIPTSIAQVELVDDLTSRALDHRIEVQKARIRPNTAAVDALAEKMVARRLREPEA